MNDDDNVEVEFKLFNSGNFIIMETEMGFMAGNFIGMLDYGVALSLTHKESQVIDTISPLQKNIITGDLAQLRVPELKEIAVEAKLSTKGPKIDLVKRIAEQVISDIEETLEPREDFVELAMPIVTFVNWSDIHLMQDGNDWMSQQDLLGFRESVPDNLSHLQEDAPVPQSEPDESDE